MPDTKASTYDHLRDALTAAQKDCSDNDVLFIGGSNYIVGEALTLLAQ